MNKGKIKLLFIISFVFIIIGVTMSFKSEVFFKKSLMTALNESEYGKIHFISVTKHSYSGSDAILIESQGKLCLVDSGNPERWGDYDYSHGEDGKKVADYIKSIGGTHLDCIIATHNHSDHIGGIPQIVSSGLVDSNTKYYYREYEATGEDTTNPSWDNHGYYNKAYAAMNSKSAQMIDVTNDTNITINIGNFRIKLLNTESWSHKGNSGTNPHENYNSIVEFIEIGNNKVLLTADMEQNDEERLMQAGKIGPVDILKMGHHGSATSSSHDFIDVTDPTTVIVTGTPDLPLTERNVGALRQLVSLGRDTNIYYTSKVDNAIVATFNGTSYTIKNADGSSANVAKPTLSFTDSGQWTKATLDSGTAWYMWDSNYRGKYDGWQQIDSNWYYFTKFTGYMYTGWVQDDGKWYFLSKSGDTMGRMQTGWIQDDGYWYYLSESEGWVNPYDSASYKMGQMVTGWYQSPSSEKWYYLLPSKTSGHPGGSMAANICMTISGTKYCFDGDGVYSNSDKSVAEVPTADYCKSGLVYNGSTQTLTKSAGTGYTFSGATAKIAGEYTVTASLNSGYIWRDNSTDNKTFKCSIAKANPTITGVPGTLNVNINDYSTIDIQANASGKFIFSSSSDKAWVTPDSVDVSANTSVSLKISGVIEGTSVVTVRFIPSGSSALNYNNAEKTINVTVTHGGSVERTLTVKPNGGVWNNSTNNATYSLAPGATMTIPNPTRDDYIFKGWSINESSTTMNGTTLTMGSKNTSITATWQRNAYTIKFNANGGTGSMQDVSVYYNVTHILPTNKFTRNGYKFAGWATSTTGSVVYKDGATVGTIASQDNNVVTLYAVWIPNTFTVKYNANGGTGTMTDSTSNNGKVTLSNCTFTKDGSIFAGWSLSADGSIIYENEDTVTNSNGEETITVYAKWVENSGTDPVAEYTIKFNANDGTGTMADFVGYANTQVKLRKNTFTRSGYKFVGWSTSSDDDVVYTDEEEITLTSSLNLYAKWTREEDLWNRVVYDANGGTGEMDNTLFYSGTDVQLSPNKYSREGYTFMGWSTTADGKVEYLDQAVVEVDVPEITLKLYAVWKADSNGEGGEVIDNFPDTLESAPKISIIIALILLIGGYVLIKKSTKKETNK